MHELEIVGKAPERKPRTTDSGHAYPRFPNLVEELDVTRPEQVWVADITYIRLRKEFVYLAVLMEVFTRRIRGWHLGRGLDQELTLVWAAPRNLVHLKWESLGKLEPGGTHERRGGPKTK